MTTKLADTNSTPYTCLLCVNSQNSTWIVMSRLNTTCYLAHAIWHMEKLWRDVHTRHDKRDSPTRVQGCRHDVDCGGHVHRTFSRSCSWDWCKSRAQKTKLVHASTTAFFVVRYVWTSMARRARHDEHDKSSGIWAIKKHMQYLYYYYYY